MAIKIAELLSEVRPVAQISTVTHQRRNSKVRVWTVQFGATQRSLGIGVVPRIGGHVNFKMALSEGGLLDDK